MDVVWMQKVVFSRPSQGLICIAGNRKPRAGAINPGASAAISSLVHTTTGTASLVFLFNTNALITDTINPTGRISE